MESLSQVYLGCIPNCLDIFSMRYRRFGAVWEYHFKQKIVHGFWFGDDTKEIIQQANEEGWNSFANSNDPNETRSVYDYVRTHQDQQDWETRSRLPYRTVFTKPWNEVQEVWYVICWGNNYPLQVALVHRKKYVIWVEHKSVCEGKEDLDCFIDKINREHQINLQI